MEVKTFVINKGQTGEHYGLKNANENLVLMSAPNNWKTEAGAVRWAEKKGFKVVK